jgi:DNA-binding response OmpR family regulator
MNTLIDNIIKYVDGRSKDFYTKEEVIDALEFFRVEETIVFPSPTDSDIKLNGFTISPSKHELRKGKELCAVNRKQFALMYMLMYNKNKLITKSEFITKVWGIDCGTPQTFIGYMAHVKRIAPNNIFNVKGKGYIWRSKQQ